MAASCRWSARAGGRGRRWHGAAWRAGAGSRVSPASSPCWARRPPRSPRPVPGDTVALGRLEDIATGETISTAKGHAPQLAEVPKAAGRLWLCHLGVGPQGRGEAHQRHSQADRGRSVAVARPQPRHARDGPVGAGRDASSRGAGEAAGQVRRSCHTRSRAALPTRRRSASRCRCAAATRSSPAGTASWRCRGRDRAAAARLAASCSPTRSPAAWCRSNIFRPSRQGVREWMGQGPLGFPGGRFLGQPFGRFLP